MKKPIVFSVLFFILTAIPSFGQGVWIEETVDPVSGLKTGKIEINGDVYEIGRDANLEGANLYNADLEGVNLVGANLEGANLVTANLNGANLHGARLNGANLDGAKLNGTKFEEADLMDANLSFATLENTNLKWATLIGANFTGTTLRNIGIEWGIYRKTFDLHNFIEIEKLKTQIAEGVITEDRVEAIEANTAKVGISPEQATTITSNTTKIDAVISDVATQFKTLGQNDIAIGEQLTTLGQNDISIGEQMDILGAQLAQNDIEISRQIDALGQNDTAIGEQITKLGQNDESIIAEINAMKAQLQTLVASVAEKDAEIAELKQGGGGQSLEQVLEQVRDARADSVVLTVDPEGDTVTLGLTIEQSDNLIEWTKLDGEMTRTIPIPDGKKFYRFALDK